MVDPDLSVTSAVVCEHFLTGLYYWGVDFSRHTTRAFFRRKLRALTVRYVWQHDAAYHQDYLSLFAYKLDDMRCGYDPTMKLYAYPRAAEWQQNNMSFQNRTSTRLLSHVFRSNVIEYFGDIMAEIPWLDDEQLQVQHCEAPMQRMLDAVHDLIGTPQQHPMALQDVAWARQFGTQYKDAYAMASYIHKAWSRGWKITAELFVLADALEDLHAPVSLIDHLRNSANCGLGCWVIDLLLGRHKGNLTYNVSPTNAVWVDYE